MRKAHVVVGGGLNGLMLAEHLQIVHPQHSVIIIESEPECGGLLRSFHYGQFGKFDYGTHLISETGIPALDAYLTGILPEDEWRFFYRERRNLAGLYFNNNLQLHTLYPDLTTLPKEIYKSCLGDFFANLSEDDGSGSENAEEYLVRRFGSTMASQVGVPIVEKFAQAKASKLSLLVNKLCPLNRMAIFGPKLTKEISHSPLIGARVAYVDQRDIPPAECSPLASFYPKKRGIQQVIDVLVERLKAKGVQILCNQRIKAFKREGSLTLQLQNGLMLEAEKLYWTANVLGLAHLTGVKVNYAIMDKPLSNVLCHFMLEERPALADLYFLYCADPGFKSYRITNYEAFCPSTNPEVNGFPVTVELLLNDQDTLAGGFEALALQEMRQMGIVSQKCKVHFYQAETLKYGFPRPTLANMTELRRVREQILAQYSEELSLLGVGSRDDLFFMIDILRNTFAFIQNKRKGFCE